MIVHSREKADMFFFSVMLNLQILDGNGSYLKAFSVFVENKGPV